MIAIINRYQEKLSFFFALALMAGMIFLEFARVVPSMAIIGLWLTAFLSHSPGRFFRNYFQNTKFFIFSVIFLFLLPSWFYSDNMNYYLERLQVQAPALLLPMAFANLRPLSERLYHSLLSVFFMLLCLTAAGTLYMYINNYELVTYSYILSKVMPNPFHINHVRFSLMTASCIFMGFYLRRQKVRLFFSWEPRLYLFLSVFLLVFLHIYSVRSGMLGFYAASFALVIYHFIIRQKKYLRGLGVLGLLILAPVIAMMFSPTLANKTENTLADLKYWKMGRSANNLPMATRFVSYKIAFDIASENPLFGCGLGDLEDEKIRRYEKDYPDIEAVNRIIPHNQFIYYYAATGITGLIIFCFAFFYVSVYIWRKKLFIPAMHMIIVTLSCMVEPTLETQLGVAVAITFILLPVWCSQRKEETSHVR